VLAIIHYAGKAERTSDRLTGLVAAYVAGIQDLCRSRNANWALVSHYRPGDDGNIGFQLLDRARLAYDGLILITPPGRDNALIERAQEEDVPVMVISRHWPDLPISSVGQDHPQQARVAMDHLVALGHRRIAFAGPASEAGYEWFSTRLDYYREQVSALGTASPELVVIADDIAAEMQALLARRPDLTAVFGVHDGSAVDAMRGLLGAGLRVPDDVSVVGVGDSGPAPAGFPPLTTVGYPARKVGRLAARVLLDQINDRELAYSRVFVDSWLVQRASSAPPRGGHAE
jgi:DNA-binding LacI/PurR family transcriptional regulator